MTRMHDLTIYWYIFTTKQAFVDEKLNINILSQKVEIIDIINTVCQQRHSNMLLKSIQGNF